jgi:DNA repair protein RadC
MNKKRNTQSTPDLFSNNPPANGSAVSRSPKLPIPVFRVQLVRERDHLTEQITSPKDAARIASEMLSDCDREVFLVLALSTASRVIGAHVAHIGTVDASIACGREVFKFALLCNARSIIIAHNHPSGNLEPSSADIQVSQQIRTAGEAIGVTLLDSLIVCFSGSYTSLADRGLL